MTSGAMKASTGWAKSTSTAVWKTCNPPTTGPSVGPQVGDQRTLVM